MELHEDPVMAAKRETLEETGRRVELTSLVGIYPVERGNDAPGLGFEVLQLLAEAKIYKPEYNNRLSFYDYFFGPHYPLDLIKPLSNIS